MQIQLPDLGNNEELRSLFSTIDRHLTLPIYLPFKYTDRTVTVISEWERLTEQINISEKREREKSDHSTLSPARCRSIVCLRNLPEMQLPAH